MYVKILCKSFSWFSFEWKQSVFATDITRFVEGQAPNFKPDVFEIVYGATR